MLVTQGGGKKKVEKKEDERRETKNKRFTHEKLFEFKILVSDLNVLKYFL